MAKKTRKNALPKHIAGVKVPKSLRKAPLATLLASPVAVGIIADMLYAGGGALLDRGAKGRRSRREAADLAKDVPARLPEAIAAAAQAFVDTLRHGRDGEAGSDAPAFDTDRAYRH